MNSPALRKAAFCMAAVAAVSLLCVAATFPALQSAGLAALFFPALVAYSRFRVDGLVIAFLVSESLVQLLKRAIFVLGPQPQSLYFGIQLLPTLLLLLLVATAFRQHRPWHLPWSGKLLAVFLALAVALTLVSLAYLPWLLVLTAIHQQLLPVVMFFIGLLITPDKFARIGRAMALLAALSVLYGLIQLIGGPTGMDRAWASETFSYSIHGGKVFAYLEGASGEFRMYSYYADPLTWGLFLLAGFLGASVTRALGKISRAHWILVSFLVLAGLFCALTRTSWAGFVVTVGVYAALRRRSFRRPWLAFCLVAGALWGVVAGGGFLYREVFLARRLPLLENAIAARYLTIGTIEARISAWSDLLGAIETTPILGQGHGLALYSARDPEAAQVYRPALSHNFLVELVLNTGLPGALLFLCFYLQWLREGFAALQKASDNRLKRAIRWIIAFSVGSMITGYLNGPTFMTYEFFLIMGVLPGFATLVGGNDERLSVCRP